MTEMGSANVIGEVAHLASRLAAVAEQDVRELLSGLQGQQPSGQGEASITGEPPTTGEALGDAAGSALNLLSQLSQLVTALGQYDVVRKSRSVVRVHTGNAPARLLGRTGAEGALNVLVENDGEKELTLREIKVKQPDGAESWLVPAESELRLQPGERRSLRLAGTCPAAGPEQRHVLEAEWGEGSDTRARSLVGITVNIYQPPAPRE